MGTIVTMHATMKPGRVIESVVQSSSSGTYTIRKYRSSSLLALMSYLSILHRIQWFFSLFQASRLSWIVSVHVFSSDMKSAQ